jgi:hypothetical protein
MRVLLVLLYLVAFLSFSQDARASGFSIAELGGPGAFTAIAEDGSALFYNPRLSIIVPKSGSPLNKGGKSIDTNLIQIASYCH